ncbi:MAG TPA: hypothetical protein VGB76_01720 [Pyrinomonadaceae bacterium]
MSYKSITIICSFVLLACMGIGYIKTSSKNKVRQVPIESEKRGTLRQQIAKAKSNGQLELNLSGLIANYEQVKNLDDALTRYTVLIAQPVEERSYLNEHDSITTWYKFKILEPVSQPAVAKSFDFIQPPVELLPLNDDEILVPRIGGTLTVDGVKVTRSEHIFPTFKKSRKYLIFVLLDNSIKVGLPDLGPAGVLTINDDNSLTPINDVTLPLEKELKARYGKSLPEIRERFATARSR